MTPEYVIAGMRKWLRAAENGQFCISKWKLTRAQARQLERELVTRSLIPIRIKHRDDFVPGMFGIRIEVRL
jgi:hypothetical protein